MRRSTETRTQPAGFTLIELLIVIAIIGLLVALVLVAAADGVRRAEERATQSLITKLETALNDRYDALLNTTAPINQTHRFLASINQASSTPPGLPVGTGTSYSDDRRAQVIAQFDYIRAELPDVFFVNSLAQDGNKVSGSYPLNFAGAPYPAGDTNYLSNPLTGIADGWAFVLPLGNNAPGLPFVLNGSGNPATFITQPPLPTTGMFGASFSAAGGIYKNLGYGPKGYDGVDNDGNGLVDDLMEGLPTGMTLQTFQSQVNAQLAKHTHKTARSEMLYAILVEGLSPLGAAFGRDDFTAREVQDTDGDGLPEFIDAWGEPLQFFRWPTYYGGAQPNGQILGTSDSQKGYLSYNGASETRQQDPLDPNQLLVSPGWWAAAANSTLPLGQSNSSFAPPNGTATSQASLSAVAFMDYFHSLVEPYQAIPSGGVGWDRGGNFNRREFFTKFLILSGGPDHQPGVAQFGKDYSLLVDNSSSLPVSPYTVGAAPSFPNGQSMEQSARWLILIENQAAVSDPVFRTGSSSGSFYELLDSTVNSGAPTAASIYLYGNANSDDITNHNISGISTGVR